MDNGEAMGRKLTIRLARMRASVVMMVGLWFLESRSTYIDHLLPVQTTIAQSQQAVTPIFPYLGGRCKWLYLSRSGRELGSFSFFME